VDDNARAFARNMFRLRVHEADGQAYEDLFVRIMQQAKPRFRPVKAHGSVGDKKNDGFDSRAGTYYQVYAPEDLRKTQGDALKKLKQDFKGLKAFWDGIYPVKRYYFVINDKYNGAFPLLEKEIALIRVKHSLEDADLFLAKDLEDTLFSLSNDIIISVVGHVPDIDGAEFLFLSGFTYFVGAWIEFEKTARKLIETNSGWGRPIVGDRMVRILQKTAVLSQEEFMLAQQLSKQRNVLIHGDSMELPEKAAIDRLVLITEKLKQREPLPAEVIPQQPGFRLRPASS
jgi:hypothetical protein